MDRGSRNLGLLSNTGPDALKIHKATKPEINVEPMMGHDRNARETPFIGVLLSG